MPTPVTTTETDGRPPRRCHRARPLRWSGLLLAVALTAACGPAPPTIDVIRAGGELRIATLVSGTTYYEGAQGPAGFEHDLASAFAASLGLTPRFVVAQDYRELQTLVRDNKAHVAAALLPVATRTGDDLGFGPSYAIARQVVVQHRADPRLGRAEDLRGLHGAALDARGAASLLEQTVPRGAGYDWELREDVVAEDLLQAVYERGLDYAVVPAFDFEASRPYYPELVEAFALGPPEPVAWLLRRGRDDSLWHAQLEFLRTLRANGEFARLYDTYFGRGGEFDYVESRALLRHYDERLPPYRADFIAMGSLTTIDWLLLAAVAYQESHWQADARSPTGVRGLMMLTRRTADRYQLDRLDGSDSIQGGALYLGELKDGLPARIAEPDRTWLALAAYNIGPAHLEDARVLTERAGGDPDRWQDVRRHLPRLAQRRWAKQARYGYARGHQAVRFVENTRRYYDILRWLESEAGGPVGPPPAPEPTKLVSPVL